MSHLASAITCAALLIFSVHGYGQGLQSKDLYQFRSVGDVEFSPDSLHIAYSVTLFDRPGAPRSQVWILEVASGKSVRVGSEADSGSSPRWSPDGQSLAFTGKQGDKDGLLVGKADGSKVTWVAAMRGSNSPLPGQGDNFSWSPDSKRIAFVSSTPGPETADAAGDPMVITRYLYKPTYSEGLVHFNDNRRLHLFEVELATRQVKQLTTGNFDEHSVDWSPNGQELLFVSNHEPNADEYFNYDVFALKLSDGSTRRLSATESCEYAPRWSPDGKSIAFLGTKRGLTDRETTMEDTHVWVMDAEGAHRRELGAAIDNRQRLQRWTAGGDALYVTYEERGSVHLARIPVSEGRTEMLISDTGAVGSYAVSGKGQIAYAFQSPTDLAQLYLRSAGGTDPRRLTSLNAKELAGKQIAKVEAFTSISNDNKFEIESFLTIPSGVTESSKCPLIVNLHGGPHGQNGPAFNFRDQTFAARGWAVLHVNYRGSTGYGQRFADAIFADQDGNEAHDVLYAVNAAVRRYLWIDRERMGIEGVSYGGQLSDWLITQTNEFKAAIPIAGIANLISYNYMTYYNQYEEMEFGQFMHQGRMMDEAWERSALKHVANVRTPTMLVHGENDPDVPIAEAEQYFVALRDVGVEAIMVRYPREGHGLHETKHVVDLLDRSVLWYEQHFPKDSAPRVTNVQP